VENVLLGTDQRSGAGAVSVRAGGPEDVAEIIGLLQTSLGAGGGPKSAAFWRWKHEDNPFGESPYLVAEAEGSIVGVRVFMRWKWLCGGDAFNAVRAVDTATHPDWQRRGIFSRLTLELAERCEKDGVSFVFNTPNDRSRPGYLKMGWQAVGRVPIMLRPLRPHKLAWSFLGSRPAGSRSIDIDGFPGVDELLDSVDGPLLEPAATADRRFRTPRSPAYLRWRYDRIPGVRYCALWDRQRSLAALIFHGKERGGLREVCISELLLAPGTEARRVAARLLRELARSVDADYLVACAAGSTAERSALKRAVFLPVPGGGSTLCVRRLHGQSMDLDPLALSSWCCALGDLELF